MKVGVKVLMSMLVLVLVVGLAGVGVLAEEETKVRTEQQRAKTVEQQPRKLVAPEANVPELALVAAQVRILKGIEELALTQEQMQRLLSVLEPAQRALVEKQSQMTRLMLRQRDLLLQADVDKEQVAEAERLMKITGEEAGLLQKQLHLQVARILTADQLKKVGSSLGERFPGVNGQLAPQQKQMMFRSKAQGEASEVMERLQKLEPEERKEALQKLREKWADNPAYVQRQEGQGKLPQAPVTKGKPAMAGRGRRGFAGRTPQPGLQASMMELFINTIEKKLEVMAQ